MGEAADLRILLNEERARNERLQHEVASARAKIPSVKDTGIGGALALAKYADNWLDLSRAVERLPNIYDNVGEDAARDYALNVVGPQVELLDLVNSRTPLGEIQKHTTMAILERGFLEPMFRSDAVGRECRRRFLQAVHRHIFAPSVKAVYKKVALDREFQPFMEE